MQVSTKAIVVSKLRYKDHDLIVKCYTEQFGIKSYLLKNVLKPKKGKFKPAYFQPLTIIDIEADHKDNRSLQYLKDIKVQNDFESIHTNIIKSTIAMFLAEVLSSVLKEEEKNLSLYNYLETSLIWFNENKTDTNFHFIFLIELTKYLGFYPDKSQSHLPFFNLEDGKFYRINSGKYFIEGENLTLLKQLLGIKFDTVKSSNFILTNKLDFLNMLLLYLKLHLDGFKQPKSVTVLNQIFH
ncbi:MAG: DNA repair protein RecO [Flavobacteriaceae bacterium]|nr:DNA repair protein RecO [Flavobacteriaceae bacterium]